MYKYKVTVFTPTYNRGYIIEKLYNSLKCQTYSDFEWLVIDDGSNDNTTDLLKKWLKEENKFEIRYYRTPNGGKQRAINKALELVQGEYIFIVDSDDVICDKAIEKVHNWLTTIEGKVDFAGVSGLRGDRRGKPIGGKPKFYNNSEFVDATNLERDKYNLQADMAEVYKVDVLKKYPFTVFEGETFVPEAVVWNQIALDEYKLRWFNEVIYICEYLEDGLTKSSWKLLRRNPIGYAYFFNHSLKYTKGFRQRYHIACQHIVYSIIGKQYKYIFKSEDILLTLLALPIGIPLSIRRLSQLIKNT
ncbi:glycosyltransferase family 2 protein [Clostridium thermarum]|uniref:glycosyltransferase family 2 protein n=1 Tax=Clostridium thermarum TaxID=1716543 RepID=UPI001121CB5C|nr:glycosyltransferase family 2 protein [Clostridium thermarum]